LNFLLIGDSTLRKHGGSFFLPHQERKNPILELYIGEIRVKNKGHKIPNNTYITNIVLLVLIYFKKCKKYSIATASLKSNLVFIISVPIYT